MNKKKTHQTWTFHQRFSLSLERMHQEEGKQRAATEIPSQWLILLIYTSSQPEKTIQRPDFQFLFSMFMYHVILCRTSK